MTVNFYNYTGDDRVADKTLTAVKDVTCSVYDGCTIINPILRLSYDSSIANSNYFYISDWGRYYKVTNVEVNDAKQMYVSGSVDVLKSFWDEINNCVGHITRNENVGLGYIADTKYPANPCKEGLVVQDLGAYGYKFNLNPTYILTMK